MTNTFTVNKKNFIKSYRKVKKQRGLSTMEVAKRAHLTPSYIYHVISPRNKRPINSGTVLKVGKGLELKPKENTHWLRDVIGKGKNNVKSKHYSLSTLTEKAMKQHKMSASDLSKASGLDIDYIHKLLNAKELVKASKMDLARLANSLKLNVNTLEKARNISLNKYKKNQNKDKKQAKKDKDSKLAKDKNASLLKFLKKRDKKDQKRRAKNSSQVTQHVKTGNVSIGNSKNPFSLNKTSNTQPAKNERNPFLNGERLNVQALVSTASQLSDMDISILNMIAQRLLQAEYKNE